MCRRATSAINAISGSDGGETLLQCQTPLPLPLPPVSFRLPVASWTCRPLESHFLRRHYCLLHAVLTIRCGLCQSAVPLQPIASRISQRADTHSRLSHVGDYHRA